MLAALSLVVTGLSGCESGVESRVREAGGGVALRSCGGDLECATVSVAEDPTNPGGRTIDLAVVVAPSTSRTPAPDPVFLLAGGPGQGAAELAPMVLPKFDAIRRERDVVFVDLRGTGASSPLDCAVEDPHDVAESLAANFDVAELDACLAEYDADTRLYTTPIQMDDLDAVRAALGYERINLFGISYGSRAALVYMRRHPERVRAAVLDGVVPLDVPVAIVAVRHADRALRSTLSACSSDADCRTAFGGLERKLTELLDELEHGRVLRDVEHPRTGALERVDVSPAGVLGVLRMALYVGERAALIPLAIDRAHAGDFGPLAAMVLESAHMAESMSMGLYLSVSCAEDLAELDADARAEAVDGLRYFDDYALTKLEAACERWPHAELSASYFEPVASDAPTLILSGAGDPVTPPEHGQRVADRLGRARHIVADGVRHGVWWRGCAPKLTAKFLATADVDAVDPGCLDAVVEPRFFVNAAGSRLAPVPEVGVAVP